LVSFTHVPVQRSGRLAFEQVPAPHPLVGSHVGEPLTGPVHVAVVPHDPSPWQDWNSLFEAAHWVCPGAQTPWQEPATHV
jgi:hypothetical protein